MDLLLNGWLFCLLSPFCPYNIKKRKIMKKLLHRLQTILLWRTLHADYPPSADALRGLSSFGGRFARIALLTAYCFMFVGTTFAGHVKIFSAKNNSQVIKLTNDLVSVVSFSNNFTESGKLLIFAETFAYSPHFWSEPFEAQFAFELNGTIVQSSMHYQDVFTNRTGYAATTISFADALDISPGNNTINFQIKIKQQVDAYLSEPTMNMIFIPDNGSVVSCHVARMEIATPFTASSDWQDIIFTNLNLDAGDYLIVGTAAAAPVAGDQNANFYLRAKAASYQLPQAEIDLKDIGDDGMDSSIVISRGDQIANTPVTNFHLQIRTPYDSVTLYRAALFIIYQPFNIFQPEIQIDSVPGPLTWDWSNSNSNFEKGVVYYSEPKTVLQLSSFTLITTNNRCLTKTQLLWNDATVGFPREEELANGINTPYCYSTHLTWVNKVASGSNIFSTLIGHGTYDSAPQDSSISSPSRWQSAVAVTIPEPFYLSFIIYCLLFINRKFIFSFQKN